jgi:chaperonin GroES
LESSHKIEGFTLPDTATEKECKLGIVAAVDDGLWARFLRVIGVRHVKPKDKILFGAYAGIPSLLNGEEMYIMREGEIMAVIE